MRESLECVKGKFRVSLLFFVLSVFFGLLFSFISLVAFSFLIFLAGGIGEGVMSFLTSVALVVGAFASGFISAKSFKRKGLVVGTFSGALMFFIISFIGFVFFGLGFGLYSIVRFFMLAIFGAIGGITGVNKS